MEYFLAGGAVTLFDSTNDDSHPQVFFESSDRLVVPFASPAPSFGVFNTSPFQLASGPFAPAPGTTTGEGFSGLDSFDRLSLVYRDGTTRPLKYMLMGLDGSVVAPGTPVGNVTIGVAGVIGVYGSAVAIGENDTMNVVSSVTTSTAGKLVFNKIASNTTGIVTDKEILSNRGNNIYVRLAYDPTNGHFVLSWFDQYSGSYLMAIDRAGAVSWGPVWLGNIWGGVNITLDGSGNAYAIWPEGTSLICTKVSPSGQVLLDNRTLITRLDDVFEPSAIVAADGDLIVAWADSENDTDTEVRIQAFSAASLRPLTEAATVSADANPSHGPEMAQASDGTLWVAWVDTNQGPSGTNRDIRGAPVVVRWSGFSASTPSQYLTLFRGEALNVSFQIRSAVDERTSYSIEAQVITVRGPTGWNVSFPGSSGSNLAALSIESRGVADLNLIVIAPVADPAGYGAIVQLRSRDADWPTNVVALTFDITVVAGHVLMIQPTSNNATVSPGLSALLGFRVTNAGNLSEDGLIAELAPPPPPGWIPSVDPIQFSAAPGGWILLNLSVSVPANASSIDAYCGRLGLQNPNDPYSLSTAEFCVFAGLVAQPGVSPASNLYTIESGSYVDTEWNVTNQGNAGPAIPCALSVVSPLPAGWLTQGAPASMNLARNSTGIAVIRFIAPLQALGNTTVVADLLATCEGSNLTGGAILNLTVNATHRMTWFLPGSSRDANATGTATFLVTATNEGNVDEPLVASISDKPSLWSTKVVFLDRGSPTTLIRAFQSVQVVVSVQADNRTVAGSYSISIQLSAGSTSSYAPTFSVRIGKTYGLDARYSIVGALASPFSIVAIIAHVSSLGNTPETFALIVTTNASQFWRWSASYEPNAGPGSGSYSPGLLSLDAFAEGNLRIELTVPEQPADRDVAVFVQFRSSNGPEASYRDSVRILLANLSVRIAYITPLDADLGASRTATLAIANLGDGPAGPFAIRVLLDGVMIAMVPTSPLAAGESTTLEVQFNASVGVHTLSAEIDPKDVMGASPIFGEVFESSEMDNLDSRTFEVAGLDDPSQGGRANPISPNVEPPSLAVFLLVGAGGAVAALGLWIRRHRSQNGDK